MNVSEQLSRAGRGRVSAKPEVTVRLGDLLAKFVDEQISPQQARFEALTELWRELLPPNLYRRCQIADMSGGELKVSVDSPSYANELRWCSSELLEELQQRCPQARIKRIKIIVR